MSDRPRTFEEWFQGHMKSLAPANRMGVDEYDIRAAWQARDEEVAAKDRRLEELREPMGCGHPKACWIENKRSLSHLDSFYRQQISNGMFNEDQVDSLRKDNSYCCVCAEHATLQARIDAVKALAEKWEHPNINIRGESSTDISYDATRLQDARELRATLFGPAAAPERKP